MFSKLPREKEWVSWTYAAVWTLIVYLTIPFARLLQGAVRESWGKEVFTSFVLASVVLAMGAMALYVVRHSPIRSLRRLIWLFGIGVVYIYYTNRLRTSPEEALHFVEYGVLSVLLFRALEHRVRDRTIYFSVTAIGFLLGTVDEIIQWVTPRRFWDLRDVWMNGFSVAMMQLAVARGIHPSVIQFRKRPASVRILSRTTIVLLFLLAACLSNTPARVKWYTDRIPAIRFLQHGTSMMAEYGYVHEDPDIGRFYSRFDLDALRDQDLRRGEEVAGIMNNWTDPRRYAEFLREYSPATDPFAHEARVHLFRRDHYLAVLPKYVNDPEKESLHATVVRREQLIMSRYFSNTLHHSIYRLPPDQWQFVDARDSRKPYTSPVSASIITSYRPVHVWFLVIILSCLILGMERWAVKRLKEDKSEKE